MEILKLLKNKVILAVILLSTGNTYREVPSNTKGRYVLIPFFNFQQPVSGVLCVNGAR